MHRQVVDKFFKNLSSAHILSSATTHSQWFWSCHHYSPKHSRKLLHFNCVPTYLLVPKIQTHAHF